ncbi:MAG: (p)ppGpp synthetase, RelA/SpoT [Caudoviricetes sp.]|nr:MAG: (p)ppGpp synthetase, RelA/SpoT [Caudoviricetes sp.]
MTNYEKTKIAIHYRMLGANMLNAVKAMNFAIDYHNGKRKDGSPEFSHQVFIANFAFTLPIYDKHVMETLLCSIFLHDVCEDYDVSFSDIEERFGKEVSEIVRCLTKVINGKKLDEVTYVNNFAKNPIAIIAKGCDRLHNISSMIGGFSKEKRKSYILETTEYILPMLKYGRKQYPEYELCYENIKQSINGRIEIISYFDNQ